MFLRYQTVRNIGLGLLGAGAVTGIVVAATSKSDPQVTVAATRATPAPRPPAEPATSQGVVSPDPQPTTRPPPAAQLDDAAIIALGNQAATPNAKVKDAAPGPVKVNLYEETGDDHYDRLKIDRNRDDVWDASWERKADGSWRNEQGIAWDGARWAAPPPAAADPTIEVAHTLLTGKATGDKVKDLYKNQPLKVNLYDDDKNGSWDRAKLDYDRDDVWDESWTVKAGVIERKVEKTGEIKLFQNEAWVAKP